MQDFPPFQPGLYFCEAANQGFLNLAIGETQYGMSSSSQKALLQAATKGLLYPDSSARALREKIAAHYRIESDMVFVGNGIDEIILSCALAFLNPGDECLLNSSTFAGFETSVKLAHGVPLFSPLCKMRADVEDMASLLKKEPSLCFVCNPHNPTGSALNISEQSYLFETAHRYNVVTVVDEAYAEYADPKQFLSAVTLLNRYPNVIVTRTLSKAYGLAGLRCGYGMGNKYLIEQLKKTRHAVPFNVNRLALEVGCAALDDQDFIRDCYWATDNAKQFFYSQLKEMGLSYLPSYTSFVLVEFKCKTDPICEELEEKYRILVRSAGPFGFPNWIRISLGTIDQMQYVVQCLKEILGISQYIQREGSL